MSTYDSYQSQHESVGPFHGLPQFQGVDLAYNSSQQRRDSTNLGVKQQLASAAMTRSLDMGIDSDRTKFKSFQEDKLDQVLEVGGHTLLLCGSDGLWHQVISFAAAIKRKKPRGGAMNIVALCPSAPPTDHHPSLISIDHLTVIEGSSKRPQDLIKVTLSWSLSCIMSILFHVAVD